jgi:hypothetical protein
MSLLILAKRLFGLLAKQAIDRSRVKASLFQALLRLPDLILAHMLLASLPRLATHFLLLASLSLLAAHFLLLATHFLLLHTRARGTARPRR